MSTEDRNNKIIDKALDITGSSNNGWWHWFKQSTLGFTQSETEKLIKSLYLFKRENVAESIRESYNNDINRNKKEAFLNSIENNQHEIFKIPKPTEDALLRIYSYDEKYIPDEDDSDYNYTKKHILVNSHDYKELLKKYYEDNGYVDEIIKLRKLKIAISRSIAELSDKKSPVSLGYKFLGEDHYDDEGLKKIDITDRNELLDQLATFAVCDDKKKTGEDENGFITPYSFNIENVKEKKKKGSLFSKPTVRRLKIIAFYALFIVSVSVGIGEAFTPKTFYFNFLVGLGLTGPLPIILACIAFVSAFLVNQILFHNLSYDTLKDLFIKKKFFQDSKGKFSWSKLFFNIGIMLTTMFAAFVIAGLSFYFSGFGLVGALFVSTMTFLGFTGALTYAVSGLLKKQSWDDFVAYIKALFNKNNSTYATIINSLAMLATVIYSISVIAGTSAMFFTYLSAIPLLLTTLGPVGIIVVVAIAELALGTFFIKNASKFIDAIRGFFLAIPNIKNLFTSNNTKSEPENRLRTIKNIIYYSVGGLLCVAAFINAGGFATGYLLNTLTHTAISTVFSYIPLLNLLPLVMLSPFIATSAYTMSSVGGNAGEAFAAVSVDKALKSYGNGYIVLGHNPQLEDSQHSTISDSSTELGSPASSSVNSVLDTGLKVTLTPPTPERKETDSDAFDLDRAPTPVPTVG